ncbi:MAG: hypothetical protein Q4G64_00760 [bacterium]|nr:hypothetical protein [bacterium]
MVHLLPRAAGSRKRGPGERAPREAPTVSPPTRAPWRGLLWRWRHVFLALGLAAATLVIVDALEGDDGVAVVVLASARPAGHVLTGSDLRAVTISRGLEGTVHHAPDAEGRVLAVGLPAGTPLTEGMLVGPSLADSAPSGSTVVTIALADRGSQELAVPGTSVTLVGVDETTGLARQASDVLVLSRLEDPGSGGLLAPESEFTFVVVAVPEEEANFVLQTSAAAPLRVALTPGH